MNVVSLRLGREEQKHIENLSKEEKRDKSTIARELLKYGWILYWFKQYKRGKVSLGKLSQKLSLSLSETLDLLAEFGIESPLEYSDYLEGFNNLRLADK
jgi:predicted HTH domain antitoxin